MSNEFILMDEYSNNLIIMNENMYKNIVENIAINHFLILFTMGCTLGIICCFKRKNLDNKYVLVANNESDIVKGEIV